MSPSVTAPTTASRSKMNRAASSSNINGHYDSFTSLNSKATVSFNSMNLSKSQQQLNTPKKRLMNMIDDAFDFLEESPLSVSMNSLSTSIAGKSKPNDAFSRLQTDRLGTRLNRSQTLLNTKSNKQTIINCLRQVVLAGPANERQREAILRVRRTTSSVLHRCFPLGNRFDRSATFRPSLSWPSSAVSSDLRVHTGYGYYREITRHWPECHHRSNGRKMVQVCWSMPTIGARTSSPLVSDTIPEANVSVIFP